MDIITKRRYTTDTQGVRHCVVTYRRLDGSSYTITAF